MDKEAFYEKFFEEGINLKTKNKLIECKNENIPDSLYKYTSTRFLMDKIFRDRMYLPHLDELNDPHEGKISYNDDKIKHTVFEMIKQNQPDLNEKTVKWAYNVAVNDGNFFEKHNREYNSSYSLICLSEENLNELMWAYYTDNYKGICIEYDLKESGRDDLIYMCFPVIYLDESNDSKIQSQYLVVDDITYHQHLIKKPLIWEHENEWRIIIVLRDEKDFMENDSVKYQLKFIKPKSIFMGFRISEDDEIKIKEICKSRKINLYKIKVNYGENLDYDTIYEFGD